MLVTFKEYEDHLIDQNSFEVAVAADVLETDYQMQAREDFRLRMPDVKFEVSACLSRRHEAADDARDCAVLW